MMWRKKWKPVFCSLGNLLMMVLWVGGFTIKLLFDKQLLFFVCLCQIQTQFLPSASTGIVALLSKIGPLCVFFIYFLNMLRDYWLLHFSYFLISCTLQAPKLWLVHVSSRVFETITYVATQTKIPWVPFLVIKNVKQNLTLLAPT